MVTTDLDTPDRDILSRLWRRLWCEWLELHSGAIESYGQYCYIRCDRCERLRQPMPRWYGELRYG